VGPVLRGNGVIGGKQALVDFDDLSVLAMAMVMTMAMAMGKITSAGITHGGTLVNDFWGAGNGKGRYSSST
jgi:hypothetical protein